MTTINFLVFTVCVLYVVILVMWATYSHKIYKVTKELRDVYKTNEDLRRANKDLTGRIQHLYDELEATHDEYKEKFLNISKLTHKEHD